MDDAKSVWDDIINSDIKESTDNIEKYMHYQCKELEKYSHGNINARYIEVKPINIYRDSISGKNSFISSVPIKNDKENLTQINANQLYIAKTYVFDVFNNEYQFRLFSITYKPMYPVTIEIDLGIVEEIESELSWNFEKGESKGVFDLKNDAELDKCFLFIIRSKKFRFIIKQLMVS